jgi:hypothetical protein
VPSCRSQTWNVTKKIEEAKYIATVKYQKAKNDNKANKENTKLANGVIDKIIAESVSEVGLPQEFKTLIPKNTLISRVLRNNVKGKRGSFSQSSPMADIEPLLAELCRHHNRMAKSITQTEFLALANDIIKDTPTSAKLIAFQTKICGLQINKNEGPNRLGKKYFYNFMNRFSDIIHTTKITKKCISRLEWATYDNIKKMYNLVYREMVVAGIAEVLEEAEYFDKDNKILEVFSSEAVGTKSKVRITDPSYLLFVDETGSSTNMKKDKTYGKKVIAELGFAVLLQERVNR